MKHFYSISAFNILYFYTKCVIIFIYSGIVFSINIAILAVLGLADMPPLLFTLLYSGSVGKNTAVTGSLVPEIIAQFFTLTSILSKFLFDLYLYFKMATEEKSTKVLSTKVVLSWALVYFATFISRFFFGITVGGITFYLGKYLLIPLLTLFSHDKIRQLFFVNHPKLNKIKNSFQTEPMIEINDIFLSNSGANEPSQPENVHEPNPNVVDLVLNTPRPPIKSKIIHVKPCPSNN